jgi:hypothetical protein
LLPQRFCLSNNLGLGGQLAAGLGEFAGQLRHALLCRVCLGGGGGECGLGCCCCCAVAFQFGLKRGDGAGLRLVGVFQPLDGGQCLGGVLICGGNQSRGLSSNGTKTIINAVV